MAKFCAWIPQVKKNDGTITDSRLFKELAIFIKDRKALVKAYNVTKNPDFIKEVNPSLQLDEANEPTLASLIKNTTFSKKIPEESILDYSYKSIDLTKDNSIKNSYDNVVELQNKANAFNKESLFKDLYIATVNTKEGNLNLEIVKKTKENSKEELQKASLRALNKRLSNILSNYGVSIGVLSEIEEQMKIKGVTDFDVAKKTAEGFIELIRLSKDDINQTKLPEEFSHAIIEMLGDKGLVNRLINHLNTTNQVKDILGTEYDFYNEAYQGNEYKLAKEAAGKLLAEHLIKQNEIPKAEYKNILTRAIQYIKDFFKTWDSKLFQNAIIDTNKEFSELAKNILNQSIENISVQNISETGQFYNLEERVNRGNDIIDKMISTLAIKIKIKEAKNKNGKASAVERELLDELENSMILNNQISSMYKFLDYGLKEIKALDEILENSLKTYNLNDNALSILNAKNQTIAYNSILDDIMSADLTETFEDNRHGKKLEQYVQEMKSLQGQMINKINKHQMSIVKDIIKKHLKDNSSNTITFSDEQIEQMFTLIDNDISVTDRLLGAASQTNNEVLKLMDKMISDAKEIERLEVLDVMKEILAAGTKLEQAGFKNTVWMYKEDNMEYISYEEAEKLHPAQFEFWKTFITYKMIADKNLPPSVAKTFNTIKVRKDTLENITSAGSLPEMYKALTRSLNDGLLVRSDDVEYSTTKVLRDFAGKPIQSLPIYYLNLKEGETGEVISTDAVSSLVAYFKMSTSYKELNNIAGMMELLRDQANKIKIKEQNAGKTLVEQVDVAGKTIMKHITKEGSETELVKRIDKLLDMQFYQNYMKDYGDTKKIFGKSINKTKALQKLSTLTAFSNMSLNLLSATANIANSEVMMRVEATGGQFYNHKNLAVADAIFTKGLPQIIASIGKRVKTDKISLFAEMFDVGSSYEEKIRNINFDKKTLFSKTLDLKHLMFLNGAGEFWASMKNTLAMADNYRLKDSKDNEISLWDSLEVVYIDDNNKSLGARLLTKEGVTKLDGTGFTYKDLMLFTQKSKELARYLYGNYDSESKNALQSTALGSMAMMYRRWLVPAIKRRYGKRQTNHKLDSEVEGYYRTALNFTVQMIKDAKAGQFMLMTQWNDLEDFQKSNIRKAIQELFIVASLSIFFTLLDFYDDDDDEEAPWLEQIVEYTSRRLLAELSTIAPSTGMIDEFYRTAQNPVASIRTLKAVTDLIGLLNPLNYETFVGEEAIIESGYYKDHSRAEKLIRDTPAFSLFRQIDKAQDLDYSIQFFK